MFALGLVFKNEASNLKLTLHMIGGHPFDVSKSLLGRSDQLRPPLLQPPLVLVLLVKPAQQKCSLRFDHLQYYKEVQLKYSQHVLYEVEDLLAVVFQPPTTHTKHVDPGNVKKIEEIC